MTLWLVLTMLAAGGPAVAGPEAAGSAAAAPAAALQSGPAVGAEAPAFDPWHVAGPDKGSHACPMCKYGKGQGVLAWVNTQSADDLVTLLTRFEKEIRDRGEDRLRAFVIYMNPDRLPRPEVEKRLQAIASSAGIRKVALTWVPSPTDEETAALYDINPDPRVTNTMIVYRKRRVVEKFVNLPMTPAALDRLIAAVGK